MTKTQLAEDISVIENYINHLRTSGIVVPQEVQEAVGHIYYSAFHSTPKPAKKDWWKGEKYPA